MLMEAPDHNGLYHFLFHHPGGWLSYYNTHRSLSFAIVTLSFVVLQREYELLVGTFKIKRSGLGAQTTPLPSNLNFGFAL
jgi:hypothetical protein